MIDTSMITGSGTQVDGQGELVRAVTGTQDDVNTGTEAQDIQGIPVRLKKKELVVTLRFNSKTLEEQRKTKELNERIKRRG